MTSFEHAFDVTYECLTCGEGKSFHVSDPKKSFRELEDEHYMFMMAHFMCPLIRASLIEIATEMGANIPESEAQENDDAN